MDKYIVTISDKLAKSPESQEKKELTAKFVLLKKDFAKVKKEMASKGDLNKAKSNLIWGESIANSMKRDPDKSVNEANVAKLEKYLKVAEENIKGSPDSPKKKELDEKLQELKKVLAEAKSAL